LLDLIVGGSGTTINSYIYETDGETHIDLSTATAATLIVEFPDGETVDFHTGTIVLASTPGWHDYVSYTTVAGDFPIVGTYILEMQVLFPTGVYNSNLISFRVGDSLISVTPVPVTPI